MSTARRLRWQPLVAALALATMAVPVLAQMANNNPVSVQVARAPQAGDPPPITNLRSLYVLHCAGCHSRDASGYPEKGVPSMRGALGHFSTVPEGRAFLVQVPGVNNAGLSDEQIAQLTSWMVRQFSADTAPAGWVPYTAAEVVAARAQRPADIAAARAAIVARLQRDGLDVR
ncbi:cytochrome C [Ideonella sp. A 288]|uniref:cytochrome C n=1 Tax=Ideonella sp. A 288 TaxID=1962181 RepID=UPI000B4A643B|nr:cytochrome C [Ideonella sp. A 288]